MAERGAPDAAKPGRPYFSPTLVAQIRSFFDEHPEMGGRDLTEFAQDAARHYLEHLQKQAFRKEVLRLARDGRLPSEAVDRLFPRD